MGVYHLNKKQHSGKGDITREVRNIVEDKSRNDLRLHRMVVSLYNYF
jgi:hypothetical protein